MTTDAKFYNKNTDLSQLMMGLHLNKPIIN